MKNIPQAYRPSYLWFWPPIILGGSVISAGTIHDLRRVKVPDTGPLWNPWWVNVLFVLFVFVCVWWCLAHIILCFCFVYLRLVNHMLPVSLDCPFWLPLWYSLTFIVCCLPIKCNINSAVFITNNDQFLVFLFKKIHPDSVWFKH
jgi:hypothetical protein